jgi:tetratricopeptide (TPR) repeat protein
MNLQRQVRVFVSSTFLDMRAERDELELRIFPQLKRFCEKRGIIWADVDLRWGVTEEQASEGKMLPICLKEIDTCRPFFIGILGERYGTILEIPRYCIEAEPWLSNYQYCSTTELEVQHGALNDPNEAIGAFFYFRDPFLTQALSEKTNGFSDDETSIQNTEKSNKKGVPSNLKNHRHKLVALKKRIKKSGLPVRSYASIGTFGELVLEDLTSEIKKLYPEPLTAQSRDFEEEGQNAVVTAKFQFYIKPRSYFDRLNKHVEGNDPPLVITGNPGSGKSALLVNWSEEFNKSEIPCFRYFIGATPGSTDSLTMLRRLMREIAAKLGVQFEIPDAPGQLRTGFKNLLYELASRSKIVIVIDGIDQLEDDEGIHDILWLPPKIPPRVRLVLSTRHGRSLDLLKERGYSTFTIGPLKQAERVRFITNYLAQFGKRLSKARVSRLAGSLLAANPLYLRALLDELRIYGIHYKLDTRIDFYTEADSLDDFFQRILQRYEEHYNGYRPQLVQDAMSLLWAARHGLSERELAELLGKEGRPVPSADLVPLLLAVERSLVNRSGLMYLSHDFVREAISKRYLTGDEAKRHARRQIANYFKNQFVCDRKITELPWQLLQIQSWQELYLCLSDSDLSFVALKTNFFDMVRYWNAIEENWIMRIEEGYQDVIKNPRWFNPEYVSLVAGLLKFVNKFEDSLRLYNQFIDFSKEKGIVEGLPGVFMDKIDILFLQGGQENLDSALQLCEEAGQMARSSNDELAELRILFRKAKILSQKNEPEQAKEILDDLEAIYRERKDMMRLQGAIGQKSAVLYSLGDKNGAMALTKEAEEICRELGYMDGLQRAYGNEGVFLANIERYEEAAAAYKKQEKICRDLGFLDSLATVLNNRAALLTLEAAANAIPLVEEAYAIAVKNGLGDLVKRSKDNLDNLRASSKTPK